jgi:hypothetical protein
VVRAHSTHVEPALLGADAVDERLDPGVVRVVAWAATPTPPRDAISSTVRLSGPLESRLRAVTYTVAPASPSPSATILAHPAARPGHDRDPSRNGIE